MRRRKRDIIIELTSLLDVIMIMIFMVMNENSKLVVQAQGELVTVQQENAKQAAELDNLTAQLSEALAKLGEGNREELLDRLQVAETMLDGYQAMDEVVVVISVNLENRSNNSNTVRCLTYGSSANPDAFKVHYANKNNDKEFNSAVNEFRVFLSDCIRQASSGDATGPAVHIVFSYNPGKVYQHDFNMIDEAISSKINSAYYHPCLISQ